MNKKPISPQQFAEKLQVVVNQPIWRVIHPADGWLFLDLGKPYQSFISDQHGNEKPYSQGEYQLQIIGDWKLTQNEDSIEARAVQPGETPEKYFTRMEALTNNFPIKVFSKVLILDTQISFEAESGYQLKVPVTGSDDELSLTSVELDGDNKPVAYTHYRFDEELGYLSEISSR